MELNRYLLPSWFSTPVGEAILVCAGAGTMLAILFWLLHLLSQPNQSRERCKLILDLLEHALSRGGNPSLTFASLWMREKSGKLKHVDDHLCQELENGEPLLETLCSNASRLPASLAQTLKAGERMGSLPQAIQACREMIHVAHSADLRTYDHMLGYSILSIASTLSLTYLMASTIDNKLYLIASEFEPYPFGRLQGLALSMDLAYAAVIVPVLTLLLWVVIENLGSWFKLPYLHRRWPQLGRLEMWIPWKRLRILRHFARVFTLAERSGLSEAEALIVAADSTGNSHWKKWAAGAEKELARGTKLQTVIRPWDVDGELEWRFGQYGSEGGRLHQSLNSWCTYLAWRALQQETRTKHLFAAGIILGNGLVVGVQAVFLFTYLTHIMDCISTW